MGLRLFDDITNIEEARNRTHTLVEKLESRFLLIAGRDKLHVKMHDVVRDVAIYIGLKEKNGFLKSLHGTSIENSSDVNCNWISMYISNERMEVPVVSRFPKLRLLMLLKSRSSSNELSDISFEGMKDLNVLSFESASIGSLPPTLGSLENLQTLCLVDCEVENISVIGELTSLKIFSCNGCHNIAELPAEIGRLSGLRLLELSRCDLLQTIPFGVISSVCRLEELKMFRSFSRWEAEENGKERRNASLRELADLPNLSCLEIEIDYCTLSAQEICLSQNLVKYYIRIGDFRSYYPCYFGGDRDYEKVMILNLPSDIGAVGKWIQKLVRNTELLYLQGDGSNNFNMVEIENLRSLRIQKCSTLKKLVDTKDGIAFPLLEILRLEELQNLQEILDLNQNVNGCIEFSKLKVLTLYDLPNFTAICQVLENDIINFPNLTRMSIRKLPKLNSLFPVNSETVDDHHTTSLHFLCNPKDVLFCNLKSIEIWECENLRYLFSVSVATRCLLQLEVLQNKECDKLEQVFLNEIRADNTDGCIEFPKLKELTLWKLPNLTAFCQGLENIIIKFPNLTELKIEGLPKLNSLCPVNSERVVGHDQNTCFHFVCNPKDVLFCNLKSIQISLCHNLRYLFSVSVARRCLLKLEDLHIRYCYAMEKVFWNEGTEDNTDACIEFPKLKVLRLEYLRNLTAFCQGLENIIIKFPNLTKLEIIELPKLNSLFPVNSETVVGHDQNTCFPKDVLFCNLKFIEISYCHNLRYLFSVSVARRCLLKLEDLHIQYCEAMEKVFWNDVTDDNTDGCIEFPKLNKLRLYDLPNLTALCQGLQNIVIKFSNLIEVRINKLPKLNSFFPLNSETLHDHTSTPKDVLEV